MARRLAERGQYAARPQHLQRFQERVAVDGIENGGHALAACEIVHSSHEVVFHVVDDLGTAGPARCRSLRLVRHRADNANADRPRPLREQEPDPARRGVE